MIHWEEYIVSNPKILFGKPTIINTRISVDLILEKLSEGETPSELIEAYPTITLQHIYACLAFASDAVKNEIILSKAS